MNLKVQPITPFDGKQRVEDESLNPAIDKALGTLMDKIDDQPPDVAVKILAQAISWEKVKHGARGDGQELDPDSL
jgi:hypothetical protein